MHLLFLNVMEMELGIQSHVVVGMDSTAMDISVSPAKGAALLPQQKVHVPVRE
jgi:hypothetical protein